MKLISLRLCNFRSFYGKTPEIFIAQGNTQNTTIIHGNNGAGKTSLLNAFTWVLYEKFTAAFASTEQLVNKRAIAEAEIGKSIECWVEIIWEHEGRKYRVRRESKVYKNHQTIDNGKTELKMWLFRDDGTLSYVDKHLEDIINQILPHSLHQYFFFDGERIEQIVRVDKKSEIAEATKIFLGVEVINRAIRHLNDARKTLDNELNTIGSAETKQLIQQQSKLEKQIELIYQRQQEIKEEIEFQNQIKKETSNHLRDLNNAKELQERRQFLEKQKKDNQENLRQSRNSVKKIISTRAYTVLIPQTTSKFRDIINHLKQQGELRHGISQELIHELLDNHRCICGTELSEGSQTRENIEKLLQKATSSLVEEKAIRMTAKVDEIDKQAINFWEAVDREQSQINQLRINIAEIELELDNIQEKLRKDPSEEIRNLQQRLEAIEEKITELTLEQGGNQQKIYQYQTELEALIKQIHKQKFNESRQQLAQRRIQATQEAIARLIEVKNRQEEQFRLQLEQRIQEIFSQIAFAPYIPKISEKYELTLVENTTGIESPVAASTAENQILSLSFIASIIDRVREWSQKKKVLMVPDSNTFPIVMDSPFGSLDEQYRRQIAKVMPQMVNQLIILVNKTQWRGEVETEITHRIGKQYILTYYSSKPDCEVDDIDIAGERYYLVRQSPNEFEYTEITPVNHD
ncbi:AAA family ATPase [Calothrix sp. 336/3]|uniref:AAA family ATPase n=1 Tax=Calothrix sp. 336/3 TaxID=1337936 RepID=UPI0004E33330|nr:AAA family ATPase [Calothrix sp. 336/3]AKG22161.1 SMC domain-containing protein [Calothrix sp. 336/3]